MGVSSNAIHVCTEGTVYTFNLNGDLLSQAKPFGDVCYNQFGSIVATANGINAFLMGYYVYGQGNSTSYFAKLNGTNATKVNENKFPSLNLIEADKDGNSYAITYPNQELLKISEAGTILYKKTNNAFRNFLGYHTYIVDRNDNFYFFTLLNNNILLVSKMDRDGNL